MNEQEAQELLALIAEDTPRISAKLHKIGNGEHVVIVKGVWLWSPDDWEWLRAKLLGVPAPLG